VTRPDVTSRWRTREAEAGVEEFAQRHIRKASSSLSSFDIAFPSVSDAVRNNACFLLMHFCRLGHATRCSVIDACTRPSRSRSSSACVSGASTPLIAPRETISVEPSALGVTAAVQSTQVQLPTYFSDVMGGHAGKHEILREESESDENADRIQVQTSCSAFANEG
jgi:hypothetical protein